MKKLIFGVLLASLAVVFSGLLMPMMTGLSYERFTWTAYAGTYPSSETGVLGPPACSDGLDNDLDGLVDCADPDCNAVAPCLRNVPAVSSAGLLILTLVIATMGLLGVRANSRRS